MSAINHDHRFIYIHTPRTGGNFLYKHLSKIPNTELYQHGRDHLPISNYLPEYKNYFKFATIRDPLEWYVSFYHHQKPSKWGYQLFTPQTKQTKQTKQTFTDWLKNIVNLNTNEQLHQLNHTNRPVLQFIKYLKNNNLVNNKMGFYSHMFLFLCFEDFDKILKSTNHKEIINTSNQLISVNKLFRTNNLVEIENYLPAEIKYKHRTNKTNHKPAKDYYTEETKKLIKEKECLITKHLSS